MFVVLDVLAVQNVLSVEVRRVPDPPTVTKSPFPYVTLLRLFVVPEVLEVQDIPSNELRMIPLSPTVAKLIEELLSDEIVDVVEFVFFLPQDV